MIRQFVATLVCVAQDAHGNLVGAPVIRQIVATVHGHRPVEAAGSTVPNAVRRAVYLLGLGPGRTVSSERTPNGWEWNWSGHRIVVELVQPRVPGWALDARIALHGVSRWDIEQLAGGEHEDLARRALEGSPAAIRLVAAVVREAKEAAR